MVVTLNGREHYLGTLGTAASRTAYNRLIAEWLAGGRQLITSADMSIAELMLAYDRHVKEYYRKPDGKPTNEVTCIKCALKSLRQMYGATPVREFGPNKLRALRESLIAGGGARTGINQKIGRIKAMIKWAVSRELLPASAHHALMTITGLARGRSAAKENPPVLPAPQAYIDAALPLMPSVVAAMVKLQLFTGARPGEIAAMRTKDLDMSGPVWRYTPGSHKTAHHGHTRTILIGPKAIAVLRDYIKADINACLFSPADAVAERYAKAAVNRKTTLTCGNKPGTNRKPNPKRKPGNFYTVVAYNRAIRRACDAANIPYFHAHQLRHNAATNLRAEFGLEAAKTIMGHATLDATLLYAEENVKKAAEIMAKVG